MPRFILIQESTHTNIPIRHACHVTTDEIKTLVDVRSNPGGGYTDVERCMAMITNPKGAFTAFPLNTDIGPASIHVEGRMDFKRHGLIWKEPGHRCTRQCVKEAIYRETRRQLPGLPSQFFSKRF